MHFGPAVFDLVTVPALLDLAEDLIGPEITSNPIQHVRIKPPSDALQSDEIRRPYQRDGLGTRIAVSPTPRPTKRP